MVVQEPDVCPCPQYTQVMCSPVGPELLAINVAAVGIRRRGLLDVVGTEARSLASTSHSMIYLVQVPPISSHLAADDQSDLWR